MCLKTITQLTALRITMTTKYVFVRESVNNVNQKAGETKTKSDHLEGSTYIFRNVYISYR